MSSKVPHVGCRRIRGIARTETYFDDKIAFSRVRCKSWKCPHCARVNRSQWRAVLSKFLRDDTRKWSFITITLPRDAHRSAQESAQFIRDNWNTLMKAIKDEYKKQIAALKKSGQGLSYIRVLEQHKSGAWHVHLLISIEITDSVRKERKDGSIYWQSATIRRIVAPTTKEREKYGILRRSWGYIHDAQNLETNGERVAYVTKYMTKRGETFEDAATEKKLRVIQTSRDIKFNPEKSPHDWQIKSAVYREDIARQTWHDLNRNRDISEDDMQPYYPHPDEYIDT